MICKSNRLAFFVCEKKGILIIFRVVVNDTGYHLDITLLAKVLTNKSFASRI